MLEETLVFVDGENLSIRYKSLLLSGRTPRSTNSAFDDFFIWNNEAISQFMCNIRRVSYYTSVVGDDTKIKLARSQIASVSFSCELSSGIHRTAQIFPVVRKKDKKSNKESICDVNIATDVMRACYRDHARTIWVFSGDGDFIQLFQEIAHSGKRVFASAFSSGLCEDIPSAVDRFHLLDDIFFMPPDQEVISTPKRRQRVNRASQETPPK